MNEITALLSQWQLDEHGVRERMYRAPSPRERERWHALWLLARGWSCAQAADALERDPHTIGDWLANSAMLGQGVSSLSRQEVPPRLGSSQQAQLKVAVQGSPQEAGVDLANWNWKVVREFIQQHFGLTLTRSSCLNYLLRLGFVLKRPKKRLLKAADREAFVVSYAILRVEAQAKGAKIFFVDEAQS